MKRILPVFFIFSVFITGSYWSAYSNVGSIIYFYNPETNINNFATLKTAFDTYLVNHGGYYFQPFDSRENFEAVIKEKKRRYLFIIQLAFKGIAAEKCAAENSLGRHVKGQHHAKEGIKYEKRHCQCHYA